MKSFYLLTLIFTVRIFSEFIQIKDYITWVKYQKLIHNNENCIITTKIQQISELKIN